MPTAIFRIGRVDRDRARDRRSRLPGQDRRTTASTSTSTGPPSRQTSCTRSSRTRSSPTCTGPGPQRQVSEIYITEANSELLGARRDQGPPHPLLAEGRPANASTGRPPTIRPGSAAAGTGRPPRIARLKDDPSLFDSIARKRERREPGPRRRPAPAASCRTSTSTSQRRPGVQGGDPRPRRSSPATSCRRSSPPSAGTSSRSCTARPTTTTSRTSRPRPTAAPTSPLLARDNSGGTDGEHRRRPRLGRQGPAEPTT